MKRVLILDNDGDVLDVMQEALSYEGFDVTCISESDDIFGEIARYNPDLLMLDYVLDGVNGSEICKNIKSNPETQHLPVVIISAYPFRMVPSDVCDDFIAKPFDLDDLTERIKKLTERRNLYAV